MINDNGQYVTDNRTCHYCFQALTVITRTKDHVVPRALGGLDVRWNIVYSCRADNSSKASTWPICRCSFCRRTIRRHWELLRIQNPDKKKKKG